MDTFPGALASRKYTARQTDRLAVHRPWNIKEDRKVRSTIRCETCETSVVLSSTPLKMFRLLLCCAVFALLLRLPEIAAAPMPSEDSETGAGDAVEENGGEKTIIDLEEVAVELFPNGTEKTEKRPSRVERDVVF